MAFCTWRGPQAEAESTRGSFQTLPEPSTTPRPETFLGAQWVQAEQALWPRSPLISVSCSLQEAWGPAQWGSGGKAAAWISAMRALGEQLWKSGPRPHRDRLWGWSEAGLLC